ncbi:hypothetical protein [Empedobacter falsenii]|uniref:Uncharacterized protein n=1 Tax=Empedobacter falsenii TaxID=343874 RepID=A0A376FZZ0_9FLAO|nr:hypothetical protein [Empedobacter falsenii]STD53925.1 Uncharacterised protein [Empedobacter falsenii]
MSILNNIIFESPENNYGTIKATVHKTGKLGFSSGAEKFMNLKEDLYTKIGFDTENSNKLYLILQENSENAFKISKAGEYYYINLKHIFDSKNIDYKSKSIIYDIKKERENDTIFFILTKREKL